MCSRTTVVKLNMAINVLRSTQIPNDLSYRKTCREEMFCFFLRPVGSVFYNVSWWNQNSIKFDHKEIEKTNFSSVYTKRSNKETVKIPSCNEISLKLIYLKWKRYQWKFKWNHFKNADQFWEQRFVLQSVWLLLIHSLSCRESAKLVQVCDSYF